MITTVAGVSDTSWGYSDWIDFFNDCLAHYWAGPFSSVDVANFRGPDDAATNLANCKDNVDKMTVLRLVTNFGR